MMERERAPLPAYPPMLPWAGWVVASFGLALLLGGLVAWLLGGTHTEQYLLIPLVVGKALQVSMGELVAGYLATLALGGVVGWWLWHRPLMRHGEGEVRRLRAAREQLRLAYEALRTAAAILAPLPEEGKE